MYQSYTELECIVRNFWRSPEARLHDAVRVNRKSERILEISILEMAVEDFE
jgi:pyridoxine/pyridoxamine 5'-phosphate oxidase